MIRLFRKIRLQLISDNKIIKYFSYAFGEILLVVIGILIALQVNIMNEERKSRNQERIILNNLLQDFKLNEENFIIGKERINRLIDYSYKVLAIIQIENQDLTLEQKELISTTDFFRTEIITGTLDALLSTDNFNVIRDDSLKRLLTSYPAKAESLIRSQDHVETYVRNYQRPLFRRYISLIENCSSCDEILDKKNFPASDYHGLLNNIEYQNILLGLNFTNRNLIRDIDRLKADNEAIIQKIELILQER